MARIVAKNLQEMRAAASLFISEVVKKHRAPRALVVGLSGELGSGKTAFVKEFATIAGIEDTVISPTFVLERIYKIPKRSILKGNFDRLVHIDAYRLSDGSDFTAFGWKEIAADPRAVVFVEWPDIVRSVMPKDKHGITFTFIDTHTRSISW